MIIKSCNDFLYFADEWKDKAAQLEKHWAKQGPHWDAIAVVESWNGQKGLVLVEAKAHTKEMNSRIKATDPISKEVIIRAINDTKQEMGSQAPIDIWLHQFYQLSNRLAYLHILNKKLGIPTWLVLVNFVNDLTNIPTGLDTWFQHYQEVYTKMDINFSFSLLLNKLVMIFPQE
jgi:hypothetical protein